MQRAGFGSQQLVSLHDFRARPCSQHFSQQWSHHPAHNGKFSHLGQRHQLCAPIAATRGRPPKQDSTMEDEFNEDASKETRDAYVVGADGLMTPVGGRSKGQEMQLMEPDPLESWVDNVVDWYDFEDEGSVLGGTNALDADSLPWKTGKGKQRFFQENILPRMNELRGREDLNFIESLPAPNYKEGGEVDTGDPIVSEEVEMNPDWDAWEFRAHAEKDARLRREREAWTAERALVGQFKYLQVDSTTDLRLQLPWDEPEREWTNEEIYNLITMDGAAAQPADVKVEVDDPNGRADILKTGAKYIESTEDFLRRTGHLLERPPTQEDLDDLGVTQLAGEFKDFGDSGAITDPLSDQAADRQQRMPAAVNEGAADLGGLGSDDENLPQDGDEED